MEIVCDLRAVFQLLSPVDAAAVVVGFVIIGCAQTHSILYKLIRVAAAAAAHWTHGPWTACTESDRKSYASAGTANISTAHSTQTYFHHSMVIRFANTYNRLRVL